MTWSTSSFGSSGSAVGRGAGERGRRGRAAPKPVRSSKPGGRGRARCGVAARRPGWASSSGRSVQTRRRRRDDRRGEARALDAVRVPRRAVDGAKRMSSPGRGEVERARPDENDAGCRSRPIAPTRQHVRERRRILGRVARSPSLPEAATTASRGRTPQRSPPARLAFHDAAAEAEIDDPGRRRGLEPGDDACAREESRRARVPGVAGAPAGRRRRPITEATTVPWSPRGLSSTACALSADVSGGRRSPGARGRGPSRRP